MNKRPLYQRVIGRVAYYLILPALWFYMPLTRRVRVIIMDGKKIMLVKHTLGNGEWCLPGGGIHNAEPAVEAAIREIKEELRADLIGVNQLHEDTMYVSSGFSFTRRLIYVSGSLNKDSIEPNWEISEVMWVEQSDLVGSSKRIQDEVAIGVALL